MAPALNHRPTVLQVQSDSGLSGGIAGYVSALVRSPALAGYRFVSVVPAAETDTIRVQAMYGDAPAVVLPPTYRAHNWFSYVRQLERLVRAQGVALMHAHALRTAMACAWVSQRTGVPLVYTNHGLRYTQKATPTARRIFRAMESWVCERASAVVAIRPFDAAKLREEGLVEDSCLHMIPTCIDVPGSITATERQRVWPPLIVGVGSLIEVKRPDRFIEWICALQATGCTVQARWIGDGPQRERMQALASRRGVAIDWCGHLPRDEVAATLARASLMALTSDFEVFPLAVIEAYAQGVPVVSGRFDGVVDFLEDGKSGLLVSADETVQVAQAMASLLRDTAHWQALSTRARAIFKDRFEGSARMAAAYGALYSRCLP